MTIGFIHTYIHMCIIDSDLTCTRKCTHTDISCELYFRFFPKNAIKFNLQTELLIHLNILLHYWHKTLFLSMSHPFEIHPSFIITLWLPQVFILPASLPAQKDHQILVTLNEIYWVIVLFHKAHASMYRWIFIGSYSSKEREWKIWYVQDQC